ncbi:uncharacterized protein LOC123547375 isoform X3 [Mercenaria mercenaria]|uniref:uncharacterized protein LOC123547375 isoform X3 n=1 Tax=Mercenaria mercenaria TaxID=6596 RepID=UPI00234EEC32|nr:uncharacterized protein LOC123547375 isoform X3 [Mercenaria mercenaria]
MESYLMMIYVTLEQESALKTFFLDQGWAFCKPDLSYTTDKLGPAAGTFPNIVRDDEFINNPSLKSLNEQSSKRKLQPPYASPSKFKRSKMTKSSEKVLDELGDNFEKQDDATHETDGADKERVVRKMPTPITVQDIDGNSKAIKVEVTDDDDKYDPAGSTADDISAMNDDYNGDTDLEDSYGPEGGMLDDSQMSRSSHLDASLNTDEDDSQASGSKQKHDRQPLYLKAFSDKKYETIIELIKNTDNSREKRLSKVNQSTRTMYHKYKNNFTVRIIPGKGEVLFYNDQEVMKQSDMRRIVIDLFKETGGAGARPLSKILREKYAGCSERAILNILKDIKIGSVEAYLSTFPE